MTNMWVFYAVLAAMLWGLNYSLAEKVLQNISPVTLLALEMLAGSIIFLFLSYFMQLKSDLTILLTEPKLLCITIVEIIVVLVASYFIVISIQSKNATAAGIIELIYPIFTILFTWLIFQENHVNMPTVFGGLFILAGVIIISFA